MHVSVLHDRQFAHGKALPDVVEIYDRRRLHLRHIFVGDDGQHTWSLFGWSGIDLANFSLGDCAVNQHRVSHILDFEFGREARLASHLRLSVHAHKRLADIALVIYERVRFFIGNELRDCFHNALH